MKKTNFLKIALTLVMAFMITGAFAQTYPTPIEHTEDGVLDYSVAAETIIQTVGYDLTLYAAPDPVFSPLYDGTGARGSNLNGTSNWTWVYGADYATGTGVKGAANENWVVLTGADFPAAGASRTFYVKEETACAAADATATSKTISVIAEPDATMVAANTGAAWTLDAATVYSRCDAGAGVTDDLTLGYTEVGGIAATYVWNITSTVIRYDADGDPVDGAGLVIADPGDATVFTGVTNVPTTIGAIVSTDFDAVAAQATPTMNYLQVAGVDVRTKYVYTFADISSTTLALSQKRAGVATAYVAPTVSQTVTYWLNLPPVTGPIYHIPNNFAF